MRTGAHERRPAGCARARIAYRPMVSNHLTWRRRAEVAVPRQSADDRAGRRRSGAPPSRAAGGPPDSGAAVGRRQRGERGGVGLGAMRDSASRQTAVTAGRENASASLVERTAVLVRGTTTRAAIAAPVMRPPSWSRSDQPVLRGAVSAATLDRVGDGTGAARSSGRRAGARRRSGRARSGHARRATHVGQVIERGRGRGTTLAVVRRAPRGWLDGACRRRRAGSRTTGLDDLDLRERHVAPAPPKRRSALRRTRRSRSAWWMRLLTVPSGSSSASAVSWSERPSR